MGTANLVVSQDAEVMRFSFTVGLHEVTGSVDKVIDTASVASYIELTDDNASPSLGAVNSVSLTNGDKGRIVVVKNSDAHDSTVAGISIGSGETQMLVYDGSNWESLSTPGRRRLSSIPVVCPLSSHQYTGHLFRIED